MPPILSQKEVEDKVKTLYDSTYKVLSIYTKTTDPIRIKHIPCGNEYTSRRAKDFMNEGKNKCNVCFPQIYSNSTKKVTLNEVIERFKKQVGEEYKYISGFTNMHEKMAIEHKSCGNIFEVAPKMFLGVKQSRCPKCSNDNRGCHLRDENYLSNILNNISYGKDYEWKEKHNGDNKEKLLILHKLCGRTYKVRPNDFQQGYQCPHCSKEKNDSYLTTSLIEKLTIRSIKFKREVKFKDLRFKNKLSTDFYLKDLNLIIEIDGSQHFKDSYNNDFNKIRLRDSSKNKWALDHSINFLRIDFKVKSESLKEIIDSFYDLKKLKEICNKYKLFFISHDEEKPLNEESYYTKINENYFKY